MGYNTTVIVLNDALGEIENDPEFGRKLAKAIRAQENQSLYVELHPEGHRMRTAVDVTAGSHANAASVIEQHHSSETALVAIGGNHGTALFTAHGFTHHHEKPTQWDLLEAAYNASTKP
jgi:hypothetical protein